MRLLIEKLVYLGKGVGEVDGKKIFVPFSAPGDLLDVTVTEDFGSYAEAVIENVVTPSPCRVKPRCPVFGTCGGCQWQHLSYEDQLKWKRLILIETLYRIGKISTQIDLNDIVLPAMASPNQWNYRNRIQLHVNSKGEVGFYRSQSKEVVEFDECFITEDWINKKLKEILPSLRNRSKGIALKKETGASFEQINTAQNEQMKKIIFNWLQEIPHKTALELYAGGGNFTFTLAQVADKVIASDVDSRAIEAAKGARKDKKLQNIEFFCESAVKTLKKNKKSCDILFLDPPRKGCDDIVGLIKGLNPSFILYISCNPATLARDINGFLDGGYQLIKSLPVDMFPQTYHIESINLLFLDKSRSFPLQDQNSS